MKILIADDSAFIRTILSKTIKSHFETAQLILCANGQEAYEQYVEQNPDLLITDLLMPIMTGQELLQKLQDNGYASKAVVLSADIQSRTKEELDALGIQLFLNKPLTPANSEALINLIRGNENDK